MTAYEMRISDWSSDVCSSDLGSDRSVAAAVLRSRRQPVAVATGASGWALSVALPAVLHADAGRLPQAPLSQVAGRAAGDGLVGRCHRGAAAAAAQRIQL